MLTCFKSYFVSPSIGNVVENTTNTVSAPPLSVASELDPEKLVEMITQKIREVVEKMNQTASAPQPTVSYVLDQEKLVEMITQKLRVEIKVI